MTNWSKETAKANSAAATMPGAISGTVMRQKACQGVAPRVAAASSKAGPKAFSRAPTTMIT